MLSILRLVTMAQKFLGGFTVGAVVTGAAALLYSSRTQEGVDHHQSLKYGMPHRGPEVQNYGSFALSYDRSRKVPVWVAQHMTKQLLEGKGDRKFSKFTPDPTLPKEFSATNEDYWDSGWSRGHMCPAGQSKISQEAMNETFYLSNIVPQDLDNNGRFWNLMENYSRDLTKKFDHVYVVSGPLWLPTEVENGKNYVKYEVIGPNNVAVPTHLYKLVLAENEGSKEQLAGAFVVPNAPIPIQHSLKSYEVPLEKLESYTGLKFLPKLERTKLKNLCAIEGCKMTDPEEFEIFSINRSLGGAGSMNYLNKTWETAKKKKLDGNPLLRKAYEERLAYLTQKEQQNNVKKTKSG